jgi:hypothetical protein
VIAMLASTFTMKNGTIANNQASAAEGNGGGIYVTLGSTFIMENGTVRGNSADSGGGVCIDRGSYFSKTGGIIYGGAAAGYYDTNTARSGAGHAVFVPEAGDGEFNSTADESVKLKWIPQAENETTE